MFENLAFDLPADWNYLVLYATAASIYSGVVLNFANHYNRTDRTVAGERIVVATLTMSAFFVGAFLLGIFRVGVVALSPPADLVARLSGSVMLLFATVVNLAGRVALGRYWSNQIEIVEHHRVVRRWPYSWSRHPLYGSLVIYGTGMGFILENPLVVVATLLVFLPAMRYRARHEESLLVDACGDEYRRYRQRVAAMLLPRLPEPASKLARGLLALILVWATVNRYLDAYALTALLTLGLSFLMQRPDFRLAYKIKPAVIVACAAAAWYRPEFGIILWLPTAAALMSISGHCPGTLLIGRLGRPRHLTTR